MADTIKKVVEVEVDVKSSEVTQLNKEIKTTNSNLKETNAATTGLTNQLDKMTGGAISGFTKLAKGIKTGITGLKSFRIALISTGIGALLVAVGTLVTYFTSTKRGAEELEVAFAAVGAAIDVIRDRISQIGEAILKVFQGDFVGAAEAAKKAVSGIGEEIAKETKAMIELTRQLQEIKDLEREFGVERAKTNQIIAQARLIAEDENKTYNQRIAALEKANKLEIETTEKAIELAQRKLDQQRIAVEMSESMEEDLQKLADLEITLLDLQTNSFNTRKRLATGLETLRREQSAAESARLKQIEDAKKKAAEDELKRLKQIDDAKKKADAEEAARQKKAAEEEAARIKALIAQQNLEDSISLQIMQEGIDKELMMSAQKYDALYAQAEGNAELQKQITEAQEAEQQAIRDKYDAKQIATEREKQEQLKQLATDGLQAVSGATEFFLSKSKVNAKRQFQITKSLQLALAIVDGFKAVTASLAASPVAIGPAPNPAGIASLAFAVLSSAIAVGKIASAKYEPSGGGGGGGGASTSTPSIPSAGGGAPQFNTVGTSGFNQVAGSIAEQNQEPVKAYVVSTDVTSQQSLDRNSREKSSF